MNKLIVIILSVLIFASFSFLSYTEKQQEDPNFNKNWWAVYFSEPKDTSLDFIIENHSENKEFNWEIFNGDDKIIEQKSIIYNNKAIEIPIDKIDFTKKEIIIRISNGKDIKYLHKSF